MTKRADWAVEPGVAALPVEAWNALVDANDPFLEHGFLGALERSESVGAEAGWLPRFVTARRGNDLCGAVPLYLKDNSYGEFIFDWAWANGAHRAGLRYFPKLVAAVPFTPVTGSRLLVRPGEDRAAIVEVLLEGVRAVADQTGSSSVHLLFCREEEAQELEPRGYHPRLSMQFHWTNRSPEPYRSFDDYLEAFRSRNRKQVRKERAVATSHGLRLATLTGPELDDRAWAALESFYRANVDKHMGQAYLTPAFFQILRAERPAHVVATMAYDGATPVAGALNFERGRHLYGRYWGAINERPMLHFELCYYRLIERAIERGYTRFEAGAQGEHKLKRGLVPAFTHSAHWIRHPEFASAIERFVEAEAQAVRRDFAEYEALSPFSRGEPEPAA